MHRSRHAPSDPAPAGLRSAAAHRAERQPSADTRDQRVSRSHDREHRCHTIRCQEADREIREFVKRY